MYANAAVLFFDELPFFVVGFAKRRDPHSSLSVAPSLGFTDRCPVFCGNVPVACLRTTSCNGLPTLGVVVGGLYHDAFMNLCVGDAIYSY